MREDIKSLLEIIKRLYEGDEPDFSIVEAVANKYCYDIQGEIIDKYNGSIKCSIDCGIEGYKLYCCFECPNKIVCEMKIHICNNNDCKHFVYE